MQEDRQAVGHCSLGLDLATKWSISEEIVAEFKL
jgi:hypothetical protein